MKLLLKKYSRCLALTLSIIIVITSFWSNDNLITTMADADGGVPDGLSAYESSQASADIDKEGSMRIEPPIPSAPALMGSIDAGSSPADVNGILTDEEDSMRIEPPVPSNPALAGSIDVGLSSTDVNESVTDGEDTMRIEPTVPSDLVTPEPIDADSIDSALTDSPTMVLRLSDGETLTIEDEGIFNTDRGQSGTLDEDTYICSTDGDMVGFTIVLQNTDPVTVRRIDNGYFHGNPAGITIEGPGTLNVLGKDTGGGVLGVVGDLTINGGAKVVVRNDYSLTNGDAEGVWVQFGKAIVNDGFLSGTGARSGIIAEDGIVVSGPNSYLEGCALAEVTSGNYAVGIQVWFGLILVENGGTIYGKSNGDGVWVIDQTNRYPRDYKIIVTGENSSLTGIAGSAPLSSQGVHSQSGGIKVLDGGTLIGLSSGAAGVFASMPGMIVSGENSKVIGGGADGGLCRYGVIVDGYSVLDVSGAGKVEGNGAWYGVYAGDNYAYGYGGEGSIIVSDPGSAITGTGGYSVDVAPWGNALGVCANDSIEVKNHGELTGTGVVNEESMGIFAGTTIEVTNNSILTGTAEGTGVYTYSGGITVSVNSKIDAKATYYDGVFSGTTIDVVNNSILTGTGGDDEDSSGIYACITIDVINNSILTGTGRGTGVYTYDGGITVAANSRIDAEGTYHDGIFAWDGDVTATSHSEIHSKGVRYGIWSYGGDVVASDDGLISSEAGEIGVFSQEGDVTAFDGGTIIGEAYSTTELPSKSGICAYIGNVTASDGGYISGTSVGPGATSYTSGVRAYNGFITSTDAESEIIGIGGTYGVFLHGEGDVEAADTGSIIGKGGNMGVCANATSGTIQYGNVYSHTGGYVEGTGGITASGASGYFGVYATGVTESTNRSTILGEAYYYGVYSFKNILSDTNSLVKGIAWNRLMSYQSSAVMVAMGATITAKNGGTVYEYFHAPIEYFDNQTATLPYQHGVNVVDFMNYEWTDGNGGDIVYKSDDETGLLSLVNNDDPNTRILGTRSEPVTEESVLLLASGDRHIVDMPVRLQAIPKYEYTVKYYKDSIDGEYLGEKVGNTTYFIDTVLTDSDIAEDVINETGCNWLTNYKPVHCNTGVVDPSSNYTITSNAADNVINVVYHAIPGSIKIIKYGENQKTLDGAKFLLERLGEDWTTWQPIQWNETQEKWVEADAGYLGEETANSGVLIFEALPQGSYRITETQAPGVDGVTYALLKEPIEVEIPYGLQSEDPNNNWGDFVENEDHTITYYYYDLTYTITDVAVLDLPSTGNTGMMASMFVWIGLGIICMSGIGYLYYKKKRGRYKLFN